MGFFLDDLPIIWKYETDIVLITKCVRVCVCVRAYKSKSR